MQTPRLRCPDIWYLRALEFPKTFQGIYGGVVPGLGEMEIKVLVQFLGGLKA